MATSLTGQAATLPCPHCHGEHDAQSVKEFAAKEWCDRTDFAWNNRHGYYTQQYCEALNVNPAWLAEKLAA